jgi:lysozyme family protein
LQKNFDAALSHVLSYTDGWSERAFNTAATANRGVTLAMLERHRGQPASLKALRALTKKETATIYRAAFWDACKCGQLPSGIDLAVFDCAVTDGPARAVRLLQEAANVKADGIIGAVTIAAVRAAKPETLLAAYIASRMQARGTWQRLARFFALGFARRTIATHNAALALLPHSPKPRTTQPRAS